MVKITLIEGFSAYVVGPWVVMPSVERKAQVVGISILTGPGMRFVIKETPRSLAERLAADLGMPVDVEGN